MSLRDVALPAPLPSLLPSPQPKAPHLLSCLTPALGGDRALASLGSSPRPPSGQAPLPQAPSCVHTAQLGSTLTPWLFDSDWFFGTLLPCLFPSPLTPILRHPYGAKDYNCQLNRRYFRLILVISSMSP